MCLCKSFTSSLNQRLYYRPARQRHHYASQASKYWCTQINETTICDLDKWYRRYRKLCHDNLRKISYLFLISEMPGTAPPILPLCCCDWWCWCSTTWHYRSCTRTNTTAAAPLMLCHLYILLHTFTGEKGGVSSVGIFQKRPARTD